MNDLVKKSTRIFFGSAVAGAGFSLGRSTYKFIKKKFIVLLAFTVLVSAITIPFFSSSKSFRWYPTSNLKWILTVLFPWHLLGLSASILVYYIYCLLNDFLGQEQIIETPFSANAVLLFAISTPFLLYLLGICDALRRRGIRINAHGVELYNSKFMADMGISEVDGGKSFTHEDRDGNMLRLESIGKDVIEFFVVGRRNKRSFIDIDDEGRFIGYSGII